MKKRVERLSKGRYLVILDRYYDRIVENDGSNRYPWVVWAYNPKYGDFVQYEDSFRTLKEALASI